MKVSESVRAVQVPDENPMHPDFTSIYLVGPKGGQSLTIDSGEAIDRYRWMLRGYLAATEHAEIGIAAITHNHSDHSGNLKWAREMLKAEIAIPSNGAPLLKGKLPKDGVVKLHDHQVIDLGAGVRVRVIVTPGHSVDSLCYYLEDEGVLFSGDTLLGSSTTTVHDLAAYRRTLKLLLELPNLQVICPGHGPLVHDPRERLQSYIDHRNLRERQIVGVLARRIVCRLQVGERVERGQRFGVMKFGSRMDLFLPLSATVRVKVGDKVVAGETTLATLES